MVRRMEMILHMNDRIRNALQAIECLTYVAQPEATEAVRQSVNVIDSVLREVERPFVRRYIQVAMEQAAPPGTRGSGQSVVKSSLAAGRTAKPRTKAGRRRSRR